ncbi:MAG: TraR/DksA family transcriptional regulator [Bacteroidales bacterium]|jgi:RNA polymerase-binding protein DksA|nr:TraR/DksA family transcriptional regulator [Bacteroidales bacterium]
MTEAEKNEIRKRVEQEIQTLRESIDTLTDLLSDDEVQSDANDWFTSKENTGKEFNEQALAKAKQRLKVLDEVLKRIEKPAYGICIVCHKAIPFERLKAVPTATRCINC